MPGLLARIKNSLIRTKAGEGQYRDGPWLLPVTGGWLSQDVGQWWNWWQNGYDPCYADGRGSAMVYACIAAYAQTIAMLPGDHWRLNNKGGRDRITTSSLHRVLRHPNDYQTMSDFMLNLTWSLYGDGNAYALALRNDRYEIDELHLMDPRLSMPQIATTGDVFYSLAGNTIIDNRFGQAPLLVPARDVLHVRLHVTKRWPYPFVGESPLMAAMQDIAASQAITQQQLKYYLNQARPSAVLTTDLMLDKEQVQSLRDRWDEQTKGAGAGGTPILTAGLKPNFMSNQSARDAQLADVLKISDNRIPLAYRIPLQVLGITGGTTYSSAEVMMQSWIASGLGFALNHIEEAFDLLFELKGQPEDYVEFDTGALLRSAAKDRIETLARAVQGGIFSPNEARAREGFDEVAYGDEPRVQQQVVPLSAAGKIPAAPGPQLGGGGPSPQTPSFAKAHPDDIRREARAIIAAVERIGRRLSN